MDYLPAAMNAAQKAGEALLSHFHSGFSHSITLKSDQSPVTQADIAANKIITEQLLKIDSSIPVLSEENTIPDFSIRQNWSRYWLIDPLDGTRGFIARSSEFCINIALIENHEPILGVIYSPVNHHCFYATKNNGAFFLDVKNKVTQKIHTSKYNSSLLHLLTGHFDHQSHFKKSLERSFKEIKITQMNSALKFTMIARGLADMYVRFGSTSEWDTAAGQCIVVEAGGSVVDFKGNPLHYNAKSSLINPSFIAIADVSQCQQFLRNLP